MKMVTYACKLAFFALARKFLEAIREATEYLKLNLLKVIKEEAFFLRSRPVEKPKHSVHFGT